VKTIILETNDKVLIGNVGGVQVYKDLIFVLDDNSDYEGLYAFNREGAFVRKYGNIGPGPGEYLSIKDFTIDQENEIIYLMDDDAAQILMYEIFTGKYAGKIRLEERQINCFHIQYNNGKLFTDIEYWRIAENSCMLQEINLLTGKQTQCWLDAKIYNKGWNGGLGKSGESFFYARNQENCKYINMFTDTIISIGKNRVEPFAVIKEKDWVTANVLSKMMEELKINKDGNIVFSIRDRGLAYNVHSYVEWKDYISFCYFKNEKRHFVFYNTKTGKTRVTQTLINELIYAEPGISNGFSCFDENGLYETINMTSIGWYVNRIKGGRFLKSSLDKYEQLRNLSEETNPIIFYYEFK
jgi:hypothetical protein